MRLHVLCGARDLLRPGLVEPAMTEELVGGGLRVATAFWLSPRCGKYYHDFLLDDPEDRRIEVFGAALAQDFGTRVEPLLVLPDLLDVTPQGAPADRLRREPLTALSGICAALEPDELVLHAVALPPRVDPDRLWAVEAMAPELVAGLATLREACLAAGFRTAVTTALHEIPPGRAGFEPLYRNAVAIGAARRFRDQVEGFGLVVDEGRAAEAARAKLDDWGQAGLSPDRTLDAPRFAALSARLIGAVLRA